MPQRDQEGDIYGEVILVLWVKLPLKREKWYQKIVPFFSKY